METTRRETIDVGRDAGVACITLNRPDSINAINDAMRREIPQALRELDADAGVRVIVVRGAGPRGFCAGADLKEERPAGPTSTAARRPGAIWLEAFDAVRKPLVAAIHGYCMGGGLEIALACDLRIAAPGALFSLPETGLGLIPGGGGTQRLPRIVGLGKALDMMITGDRIDAAEAQRCGLVTRLTASVESLEAETLELARRIAARPPLATRFVKEAAYAALERELTAGLRLEKDLFAMLLSTDDRHEAVAAFREKRAPIFKES